MGSEQEARAIEHVARALSEAILLLPAASPVRREFVLVRAAMVRTLRVGRRLRAHRGSR